MLRNLFTIVLMLILISISANSQITTLKELEAKFYEKCGTQEDYSKIKTLKIIGNDILSTMGFEGPTIILIKMPDKLRAETEIMGAINIDVLEEESGWTINPTQGITKPTDIPKQMLGFAWMQYGLLFKMPFLKIKPDDKKENKPIEERYKFEGLEKIDDKEVYKLKRIDLDNSNLEINGYFDKENLFFVRASITFHGEKQDMNMTFNLSNHQKIANVYFPFLYEYQENGITQETIVIESIEPNVPIDEKIFEKPRK